MWKPLQLRDHDVRVWWVSLLPMVAYIILLCVMARHDERFLRAMVAAASILVGVGYGSWALNGLRSTGVNVSLLRKRTARRSNLEDQAYQREVREKVGSTLTTLTALGSISFAMVVFALPVMIDVASGKSHLADAFSRVTLYYMFFVLIATCVTFLVEIESYDTARDPVWTVDEVDRIRRFTISTYNLTLCGLVYTVLLAALMVNWVIAVLGAVLFASAVRWFDHSLS